MIYQVFVLLLTSNGIVTSPSSIGLNLSVGVTVAPPHGPTVTTMSTPHTTMKTIMQNLTTSSHQVATTTAKAVTKFPKTCESLDTLVQSSQCYYALEGLDSSMSAMSLTDPDVIQEINGYCSTFTDCYPEIEKCADFDSYSIGIIKTFCDFYQFVTTKFFLPCSLILEGTSTPCTDNATSIILDFNSTIPVKCAKLIAVNSCSVKEVESSCNVRGTQSYQMFLNRHIQTWMC
ncbi:T20D4.11-like domain-containing protein [Caenorhabditis elegans]|uniref:T20D4.11-like domain-containing protein n=1 Tax=Caenorhabditis elegans TaxID=6239 RepID=B1Q276_CAEEL|nr:DUF19 domain-containing protein [Caenorhabditis elegans]CAQ16173.1 DUF19 domain-containing protein [Caenorhabditis elegans]|eukprot:NP_001123009.1 Uncharacterized protein CELE_T08G5.15 [Caenorhabditis elegans]